MALRLLLFFMPVSLWFLHKVLFIPLVDEDVANGMANAMAKLVLDSGMATEKAAKGQSRASYILPCLIIFSPFA